MRKKKICIVSAYAYIKEYINYGSLFQYYALEKTLIRMGFHPYWLRYRINSKVSLKGLIKKRIKIVFNIKGEREKRKILEKFSIFIKNNLEVSQREYYSEKELKKNLPEADYYITGSDQVWAGSDPVNYLCFVPDEKKRISYAASFGKKTIPDYQLTLIKPWLKRFDSVTVREKSGVEICGKIGINARHTVDPTLLLNKDDYPYSTQYENKKYNLLYFLNINDKKDFPFEIVDELKKSAEIKIVAGVSNIDDFVENQYLEYFSPEDWLGAYKYASCIFTNSFHGTVFALIFHKPFWVFLQKGKSEGQNERILSLLQMVNLENRICDNDIGSLIHNKIDWEKVDDILKKEREKSIRYLKEALGQEKINYEN